MTGEQLTRIVIVGGGFGGLATALALEKACAREPGVAITLISRENFHLFTPMLAEVASSSIEAKHIVSPLRAFFRKVTFRDSAVQAIDLEKKVLTASHCPQCSPYELAFDHLVLALGGITHFYGLPGVAASALPMKTLADAMALRNHVIDVLEHADLEEDPEVRRRLLTIVIVGGGFAGVEVVAELHDFTRRAKRFYPTIRPDDIRVMLVHSSARIMPETSEDLATYAVNKLRQKGVEVLLETRIIAASPGGVEVQGVGRIPTSTLVCTAGTAPNPFLETLPLRKDTRGRIVVNACLEVPGSPGLWAVGDCAAIPDAHTGHPYPPTAQHAVREGQRVAANIRATMRGGATQPFTFSTLGQLVPLGHQSAVAEIMGWKFYGFLAWWLWRTVYLLKLPGFERKVRVALDWTLDLVFPRDIVLLKMLMKESVVAEVPTPPQERESAHGTTEGRETADRDRQA